MSQQYVCYCFQHTADDIEQDVKVHGKSVIMEQILAESKDGNCNCQTNNPKGR